MKTDIKQAPPMMTTRSISIFLLVVGLLWGLIVSGLVALLGGFFGNAPPSDPVVIGKGLLSIWWMFAGPILLIGGTICVLRGTYPRAGAISALVGCLILTAVVGYQPVQTVHDAANPLITRPPYGWYAIVVVLTLVADAGAVQLYRLASPVVAK
jgi:uncharacterized membrane protein YphA (DoxX/SURF4 family)